MKRSILLFLLALTLLSLACRKDPLPAVAPPTQIVSAQPRFDGIYTAKPGKETRDMLRFVEGGKVLGISTAKDGAVERAVRLLHEATDDCARGTYAVADGVLRFRLHSEAGDVDYAGALTGDTLSLRWRSDVNGATADESYVFEGPASEADAGAKADASVVDAGAEPAAVVAPAPLVPEGTGWFCFRVAGGSSNGSRCERRLGACESARKAVAPLRRGGKVGKCARSTAAYCFTAQRAAGGGGASCALSAADCDAERAGVVADADSEEVTVSACAEK